MPLVRRFWIEFDLGDEWISWSLLNPAVGVTGFDERDCLSMVGEMFPEGTELPPVRRITADVSLAEKFPKLPTYLGVSVWRGVWYPHSNLSVGPMWRPRGVGRNPAAPDSGPERLTDSPTDPRASVRPDPLPEWWDEIPHVDSLLWPVGKMPYTYLGDQMWRYATQLHFAIIQEPAYGEMVREALDHVIARRPMLNDWFDPNTTVFLDQQQQEEYLRTFRDYLFGLHPYPVYPPRKRFPLDAETAHKARPRATE
ncbi:hypothetical protein NONO_c21030 [Nocardia nova SH22a]|uniref:Uncharacterized protein n=1 Tax=Nocardia nova SH22a TaxID=1415166 RepID=W5TI65_9NOCA|nr:hypothetical protein [Nocardia nova]AHH16901.1 hypothetical protein NONO_c21030 [Nocardia nova SH22a]